MVTLSELLSTSKVTRNFWNAFIWRIYAPHRERTILFRNGIKLKLNWTKYCKMNALFERLNDESLTIEPIMQGYQIK